MNNWDREKDDIGGMILVKASLPLPWRSVVLWVAVHLGKEEWLAYSKKYRALQSLAAMEMDLVKGKSTGGASLQQIITMLNFTTSEYKVWEFIPDKTYMRWFIEQSFRNNKYKLKRIAEKKQAPERNTKDGA